MKNKTAKPIGALLAGLFLLTLPVKSYSDEPIDELKSFNLSELEKNWSTYTKDKGFSILLAEVKKNGFERLANNERTAWGISGHFKGHKTVEVCGFDFYKKTPTGIQMCSMVWKQVGGNFYKCYMIFPVGETDTKKAFENAVEYTVNEQGKLERANSFGKCFSKCVFEKTLGFCTSALVVCGSISAGIATVSAGTVTTPVAIAVFATCAGAGCLLPLALCAIQCN